MKVIRYILLCLCVAVAFSAFAAAEDAEDHEIFVYGASEQGRELICHRVGAPDADNSILIVFGLHGFEDAYDHDGEVLRLIAEEVIAHYADQPELLGNFCLYIVPTANPDGLLDGTTKNGFGRCNALGLDINRDFPVGWTRTKSARNRTGEAPFSTAEARAIRDLVEIVEPVYGIDVHGWIHATYGDRVMAEVFAKPFRFSVKQTKSGGMLCQWFEEVTEAGIMIELPSYPNADKYVRENAEKLIQGIDAWIAHCSSEQQQ